MENQDSPRVKTEDEVDKALQVPEKRQSPLSKFLGLIRKRNDPHTILEVIAETPIIQNTDKQEDKTDEGDIEFVSTTPRGISTYIKEELEKRGKAPPSYEKHGVTGFLGTNEGVDINLLEKLKNHPKAPDGYLIGVGVSSIFNLLESFSQSPKGIVLINPDPDTAQDLREFVDELKQGNIRKEIRDRIGKVHDEERYKELAFEGKRSSPEFVIAKHLSMLTELARNDDISIVQDSIFDREVLEVVSKLPGFNTSNNLIYLSNVSDWIWRARQKRGDKTFHSEDFDCYKDLSVLSPDNDHENYYVDTLQVALDYKLRISNFIPQFNAYTFYNPNEMLQSLNEDNIDGPNFIPLDYREFEAMSINQLKKMYENLKDSDNFKKISQIRTEKVMMDKIRSRINGNTDIPIEFNYNEEYIPHLGYILELYNLIDQKIKNGEALMEYERDNYKDIGEILSKGGHIKEEIDMAKIYVVLKNTIKKKNPKFIFSNKNMSIADLIDELERMQTLS